MIRRVAKYAVFRLRDARRTLIGYSSFIKDLFSFSRWRNHNFEFRLSDLYPCVNDKTDTTPLEPIYFHQSNWCARKLAEAKPCSHVDVGSSAIMVSLLAQFMPVTMVDIRPLSLKVNGLSFVKGDILHLPFRTGSLNSLSSVCVIEHIGLGRYGDKIDPQGSEKAAKELQRVMKKGGKLYISVPVHKDSRVCFNAHRTFTRKHVLSLFDEMKLEEEQYVYEDQVIPRYNPKAGFGTGLFLFKKI